MPFIVLVTSPAVFVNDEITAVLTSPSDANAVIADDDKTTAPVATPTDNFFNLIFHYISPPFLY